MKPIIRIENLSKQYRLGTVGTGTLRNDLKRWWCRMRGIEDPFLKIGETNIRSCKGESEYVWALKDINLEVKQGEVLGIIGRNGAGKSTLLKILSRVTGPTTGRIDYNGRIGSLLEVGTGFHPELTGRENIFLNGAILGMNKAEIRRKMDEIVDFAGVERYIDTPVKRYSSGMLVRLGFAVAAHLEPEVLVVDEVLAVGDAEFQKKALGKMQDVSRKEGRTVLFVSHNMASIKTLCTMAVLLENGSITTIGNTQHVISKYFITEATIDDDFVKFICYQADYINIEKITINGRNKNPIQIAHQNNAIDIKIEGSINLDLVMALEFRIYDKNQNPLAFYSPHHYTGVFPKYQKGHFCIRNEIIFPMAINKGVYCASLFLTSPGISYHLTLEKQIELSFDGFITKTGLVFEYEKGSGFIFLK